MDLLTFESRYKQLNDQELLRVAADREELVPDAVTALHAELLKRGLKIAQARRLKQSIDRRGARDLTGDLGLAYPSFGKHFLGATSYEVNVSEQYEEFESTLWIFLSILPVVPLATMRIRRSVSGRSHLWSFDQKPFTSMEIRNLNFFHVIATYILIGVPILILLGAISA